MIFIKQNGLGWRSLRVASSLRGDFVPNKYTSLGFVWINALLTYPKNVLLMNLMGAVSTNVYYSDETDNCICIGLKRE